MGIIFHFAAVEIVQNGGLQAAEAEIIWQNLPLLPGEMRWRCGFPSFSSLIDLRAARIAETDGPGHLIKGLSCRVVSGPADDLILCRNPLR